MKKLLTILLAAIALTACDEKEVKLYPTIEESAMFTVEQRGDFSKMAYIYASQLNDAIDEFDYSDSKIEEVVVEAVFLSIKSLDGNTAEDLNLDLSIINSDDMEFSLLDNANIKLPAVGNKEDRSVLSYIQKDGIVELNSLLNKVTDDGEFTDIKISAQGSAVPINSFIHLEIDVVVRGTVVFVQTFSFED